MGRLRVPFAATAVTLATVLGGVLIVVVAGLVIVAALSAPDEGISGFSAASVPGQRTLEERLRAYPSTERIQADHRFLTEEPHVAGTPRDRELAEWTASEWRK